MESNSFFFLERFILMIFIVEKSAFQTKQEVGTLLLGVLNLRRLSINKGKTQA